MRVRILASYLLLLAVSLVVSVVTVHRVLTDQVHARVELELQQEAAEFAQLTVGRDPQTGQPFGDDVAAIFNTYLRRNVSPPSQGVYAFIDGSVYATSPSPPADLTADRDFVRSVSQLTDSRRGSIETAAGTAEYVAVPVRTGTAQGQPVTRAVLVAAEFPRRELEAVDDIARTVALVLLAVLATASVLAYLAAGRVLAPLRRVIDTARAIQDDDDLSRRITVRGRDEVAELGRTFNAMLDRLEAAFALQRNFVSDAGHELRTPITIVRGHLELMGDDPDERRETVELVTDELDRMSRLVDDLLLLAKAQRADFLQRELVDVSQLLPDVLTKASALGEREWVLEGAAYVAVEADRQRLTQALMQLAQNAVHHTDPGTVVAIGASCGAGQLRLWVRDEGEGIAEADQARVFERFSRAAAARRRSEGSGLGLAIVRAIAEAHGGSVELSSVPQRGSTFTLVLPAGPARVGAPA